MMPRCRYDSSILNSLYIRTTKACNYMHWLKFISLSKLHHCHFLSVQCRSASELHPKTHQPLHFICTSLKQGESCVLTKEADLIDEGQKEAKAILDAVKKYCADCPKEWGRNIKGSSFLETICIVTPWRKQVQVHILCTTMYKHTGLDNGCPRIQQIFSRRECIGQLS